MTHYETLQKAKSKEDVWPGLNGDKFLLLSGAGHESDVLNIVSHFNSCLHLFLQKDRMVTGISTCDCIANRSVRVGYNHVGHWWRQIDGSRTGTVPGEFRGAPTVGRIEGMVNE